MTVSDLVAYQCLRSDHCFRSIIYCAPYGYEDARIVALFPRPVESFANYNETRSRQMLTALGGPPNMEVEVSDEAPECGSSHSGYLRNSICHSPKSSN